MAERRLKSMKMAKFNKTELAVIIAAGAVFILSSLRILGALRAYYN